MNIKSFEDLHETLCKEIDEIATKREIDKQLLDNIYKLTGSIKNIDKIMMYENGEMDHSHAGGWEARGTYGNGNSYANRGRYSRDGWDMRESYDDGYDNRNSNRRGGYSRDGGNRMKERLMDMMRDADDKEREAIKRCLNEMGD